MFQFWMGLRSLQISRMVMCPHSEKEKHSFNKQRLLLLQATFPKCLIHGWVSSMGSKATLGTLKKWSGLVITMMRRDIDSSQMQISISRTVLHNKGSRHAPRDFQNPL